MSHGIKEFGEPTKVSGLSTGLRDHKKSNRAGPVDGTINNSNYSNLPGTYKQNGDHQSGSIQLGKDGKGPSAFGLNTNPKYIPRRAGGITAVDGGRPRDKDVRGNYE